MLARAAFGFEGGSFGGVEPKGAYLNVWMFDFLPLMLHWGAKQ